METTVDRFEERLLDGPLAPVLRHRLVQRLKSVSFLGTMPLVYRGTGDCSRYEHSLGVAMMGSLVARSLGLPPYLATLYELYGLVHDVGHAPLSHATEVFLARHTRLYHEGRTVAFLRRQDFARAISRVPVFEGREEEIVETLCALVGGGKPSSDMPLLGSAISIDSLDYVPRCWRYQGFESVDPVPFAEGLRMTDGAAKTDPAGLEFLMEFWRMETELYEKHIYTDRVLSAEAMLTRALEMVFTSGRRLPDLYDTSDADFKRMLDNSVAADIADDLWEGRVYEPLSRRAPGVFRSLAGRFAAAANAPADKLVLEQDVARALGVPAWHVIFHWSFVRRFFMRCPREPRSQLWLFDEFDPWRNLRNEVDLAEALALFCRSRSTNVRHEVFVKPA